MSMPISKNVSVKKLDKLSKNNHLEIAPEKCVT